MPGVAETCEGCDGVTILAPDLALADLRANRALAPTATNHLPNTADLRPSDMIELQHSDVAIATIDAARPHRSELNRSHSSHSGLTRPSDVGGMGGEVLPVGSLLAFAAVGVQPICALR